MRSSVTVGPLPVNAIGGRPVAGLLGRDFLSPFDLDLDLSAHRITLYDVRGCDAGFLPWTTPYAAIPASMPMGAALVVQVLVDGRPLRALIDTGASASLITAPGMFRLGSPPNCWRAILSAMAPASDPRRCRCAATVSSSCASGLTLHVIRRCGWRRSAWCRSSICCSARTG
jgi:Aspartyl protease